MTTKDVIKILPFEDTFKFQLLESFDKLDEDKKFSMEQLLWSAYNVLYQLKLDENTQLGFAQIEKGEDKLDDGFYDRVVDKTEKDMQKDFIQITQKVDLTAARKAMELIIQEIQAAKKS